MGAAKGEANVAHEDVSHVREYRVCSHSCLAWRRAAFKAALPLIPLAESC